MKRYPSIPADIPSGEYVYAFDKIDGSNIRVEFSIKKGFQKFGSRKQLLSEEQGILNKAIGLISQQEALVKEICKYNQWQSVILFYEFSGPNSRFGSHDKEDDHEVKLIDVAPHKVGILPPKEFLKAFKAMPMAELLYHGPCDAKFVASVRDKSLPGITNEGVVCKMKGKREVNMFKIKTDVWYQELKEFCSGNDKLLKELE